MFDQRFPVTRQRQISAGRNGRCIVFCFSKYSTSLVPLAFFFGSLFSLLYRYRMEFIFYVRKLIDSYMKFNKFEIIEIEATFPEWFFSFFEGCFLVYVFTLRRKIVSKYLTLISSDDPSYRNNIMPLHLQFTKLFVYYLIFIPKHRSCRPLLFLECCWKKFVKIRILWIFTTIFFQTYFKVPSLKRHHFNNSIK